LAFSRGTNGTLTRINAYATGGSGTGANTVDPLASQGSVILSQSGHFLFAVNAGSNTISSFRVSENGRLTLADEDFSGGVKPNSLAVYGNLLYVTNVGNSSTNAASNVTGFRVGKDGHLSKITGSRRLLSSATAQPSCIVFSRNGKWLVVSELNTNRLTVWRVRSDGTLTGRTINPSHGAGPFGSVFLSNGVLLVSEVGPNALSSYTVAADGKLKVISGSVLNGQKATCWVSVTRDENFAYTSNAGSDTITRYRVQNNGKLSVVWSVLSTIDKTTAPIDSGVSRDGRNLYVLNGNKGSISVFRILTAGRLRRLQVLKNTGLPMVGEQGMAVR
jgi:6-phosphogluconolactonase (cycloisomerase 2 family)